VNRLVNRLVSIAQLLPFGVWVFFIFLFLTSVATASFYKLARDWAFLWGPLFGAVGTGLCIVVMVWVLQIENRDSK
jgi:hypothetical protein